MRSRSRLRRRREAPPPPLCGSPFARRFHRADRTARRCRGRSRNLPWKVETGLFDRSEGAHEVAIDEERRHLLADIVCATSIRHPRLGQCTHAAWRRTQPSGLDVEVPCTLPSTPVRPDLDLNAGCLRVQPTCRVASRPAHDHRTELVARDRELGHRDHAAVGKALESGVSDEQLRRPIEAGRTPDPRRNSTWPCTRQSAA